MTSPRASGLSGARAGPRPGTALRRAWLPMVDVVRGNVLQPETLPAAMEGIDVPFKDVGKLSGEEIYKHTKKAFLKHAGADAIYMLGSGWRLLKIVRLLEQDLQVPVVYALGAKLLGGAEAVPRA